MRHKSLNKRILSILTLLLILLPLIALSVYAASSPTTYFTFAFNGNLETWTKPGSKTDVADASGYLAGVTVNSADFGQGKVEFYISKSASQPTDYRLTGSAHVNAYGTYNLFYKPGALDGFTEESNTVYLVGTPNTYYVWGCSGYFQP